MDKKEKKVINEKELSITEKIKIINRKKGVEGTVSSLCEQLELNPSTYYARYKDINKVEYLKVHRGGKEYKKISEREIKEYIYECVVTEEAYLTQEQITELVNQKLNVTISKRTIGQIYPNIWTREAQFKLKNEYISLLKINKGIDINHRWELDIRSIYAPKIDDFFRVLICIDTFDQYIVGYEVCDNKLDIDCFKVLKTILKQEMIEEESFENLTISTVIREELMKNKIGGLCNALDITYRIMKKNPQVTFKYLNDIYQDITEQVSPEVTNIIQFRELVQKFIEEVNAREGQGEMEGRTPRDNRYIHRIGRDFMKKTDFKAENLLDKYLSKYE